MWNWVSGSDVVYASGQYGTKGIANFSNVPGARSRAVAWVDNYNQLWLFGGEGRGYIADGITPASGFLNDLWRWDGNNWAWISGNKFINMTGNYNTKPGAIDINNSPGAKIDAVSWIDSENHLWLFGGHGNGYGADEITPVTGKLNDLRHY